MPGGGYRLHTDGGADGREGWGSAPTCDFLLCACDKGKPSIANLHPPQTLGKLDQHCEQLEHEPTRGAGGVEGVVQAERNGPALHSAAVRTYIFERAAEEAKAANAKVSGADLAAVVNEAVQWAREH